MSIAAVNALAWFEEEIGGRLPADYRRFLLSGVGTEPAAELLPPPGWPGRNAIRLADFFMLSGSPDRGLEHATLTAYAGRIPDVAVPLARTACGNLLIIGYDGLDAGQLWLCDRERRSLRAQLDGMRAAVAEQGIRERLDDDAVVYYWERLFAAERPWRLGFADTYDIGLTFGELWGSPR